MRWSCRQLKEFEIRVKIRGFFSFAVGLTVNIVNNRKGGCSEYSAKTLVISADATIALVFFLGLDPTSCEDGCLCDEKHEWSSSSCQGQLRGIVIPPLEIVCFEARGMECGQRRQQGQGLMSE